MKSSNREAEQNLVRYARLQHCKRKRVEAFQHEHERALEKEIQRCEAEDRRVRQEVEETVKREADDRNRVGETLLELSQFEESRTCHTMTELTL